MVLETQCLWVSASDTQYISKKDGQRKRWREALLVDKNGQSFTYGIDENCIIPEKLPTSGVATLKLMRYGKEIGARIVSFVPGKN